MIAPLNETLIAMIYLYLLEKYRVIVRLIGGKGGGACYGFQEGLYSTL